MLMYILTHSPIFYLMQSFWRDEAFSVLIAEKPVIQFFGKLSFEPPVYYLLLHFWMKLFGESEIATRSLSLLGVTLACIVIIEWADKLFKKSWLAFFLPVFFMVNPMIIYYAFEVRTYGWYIFFAVLSMYAYLNKKWPLYTLAVILGFYTHTYFVFTFFSQIIHYVIYNWKRLSHQKQIAILLFKDPMVKSVTISLLVFLPWIIKILKDFGRLKQSWYFPVDFHLIKSVLGNMFIGYEGTPWFMWTFTAWLSLILLLFITRAWKNKSKREITSYFLLNVFVPLGIVIGVSFIKPLFVNRYLIPVTVSEIFLVAIALETAQKKMTQLVIGGTFLIAILFFNSWYPMAHPKTPIRNTMLLVNRIRTADDSVYATNSLVFFETLYYSQNRNHVYLFNPSQSAFPWYVGDAAFSQNYNIADLPVYPKRAIIINPDGTYKISFRLPNRANQTEQKPK
jgi:mannosyltransferase